MDEIRNSNSLIPEAPALSLSLCNLILVRDDDDKPLGGRDVSAEQQHGVIEFLQRQEVMLPAFRGITVCLGR